MQFKLSHTILFMLPLCFMLTGCSSSGTESFYSSADDITIRSINERSTPELILSETGHLNVIKESSMSYKTEDSSVTSNLTCVRTGDITQISYVEDDGYVTQQGYYSNDPADPYIYTKSEDDIQIIDYDPERMDTTLNTSLLNISEDAVIDSIEKDGDLYQVHLSMTKEEDASYLLTCDVAIDPKTGYAVNASTHIEFKNDVDVISQTTNVTFDYSDSIHADDSLRSADNN